MQNVGIGNRKEGIFRIDIENETSISVGIGLNILSTE